MLTEQKTMVAPNHDDRVFGQPQLIGNLLVQKAIGQAQQHAKLLGRELRQPRSQIRIGF